MTQPTIEFHLRPCSTQNVQFFHILSPLTFDFSQMLHFDYKFRMLYIARAQRQTYERLLSAIQNVIRVPALQRCWFAIATIVDSDKQLVQCTLYICTYCESAHPFSWHPWIREMLQMLKISLFHLLNTRYDNNMTELAMDLHKNR